MEAVLERPKQEYKFNRKLSGDEIREIVDSYDYEPYVADDEDDSDELDVLFDKYGNPTEPLIRSMYETENGLTTPTTLDELIEWADSL
ncbi:MAG: hypothetical protein IJ587_01455 [Synergistaceae bacterium]|nr:hypothetical protein [Synergistaceae bacterium]